MRSGTITISSPFFTLFVYGTLMRGGVRHGVLVGQRFLGEARTRPEYALFDLGAYPGLVRRDEGGRAVFGELYEVAASLIERLDCIEGAPSLFRLEPVLIDGFAGDVFTYIYQRDTRGCPLCAKDRWTNERGRP
ncbi:MAG TPA: gamma-glutamylcyclotransferase family protein [Gemmataceae bacterium]